MEQKKTNKLLPILLAVLVVIACAVWYFNKPQGSAGTKTVTVEVYHGDGSEKTFTLETQAENLRGACEEQDLIQGTESDYGLYVLTVDGETADETEQQWWCITKDGEEHSYGVDDTMIQDGEQYEFTLKTGW